MTSDPHAQIAERYVAALFALAQQQKALEPVSEQLTALAAAVPQSPLFKALLTSPLRSATQKAASMRNLTEKLKLAPLTAQFLQNLAKRGRLSLLPEIARQLQARVQAHKGEMPADITSARALSADEIAQLTDTLSRAYGKRVAPRVQEDASLIGGLIIHAGGRSIDSSVKGKLDRLAQQLKQAA